MIEKVRCAVPAYKKIFVGLIWQLSKKVKRARQKSEVDRRKVAQHDEKIEEFNLKAHLLTYDS